MREEDRKVASAAGDGDAGAAGTSDHRAATVGSGVGNGSRGQDAGELERLRAQIGDLEAELAHARRETADARAARPAGGGHGAGAERPARHKAGWRGPISALLIVIACVLAPVSVVAVWTANQVSNTDRYVANVSPLINEPAVKNALTDKVSTAVSSQIHVQLFAKQAAAQLSSRGLTRLGALISNFSGSIASGVDGLIHSVVAKVVNSQAVANLWIRANRQAHTQLVKALSGQHSALTVSNGKVVIQLGPFITKVEHRLAARGLTLVSKLPPINPTFPLFSAKYLVKAQTLYRSLTTLKWVLPLLSLALFAVGVYIAKRHRRALVGAGLGLAGSMLVLGAGLAIARGIYLNKVPSSVLPADAAAVVFDTFVRFIKQGLRVLLVLGLVVAAAGFFTGSSITAVRTREGFKTAFEWLRGTGERAGVNSGPVGTWVYRYRTTLRVAAVAGAVLAFIFWTDPTGVVVLVIALILLLVLGLIELIGRPPMRPASATPARAEGPPD